MRMPELTADRKVREAQKRPGVRLSTVEIPGLDLEALSRKYQNPLAVHWMSFAAPIDMKPEQLVKEFQKQLDKWLAHMGKDKWEIAWERGVKIEKGRYPYLDLASGKDDFNRHEYIVRACFYRRHPKSGRVEVEPEIRESLILGAKN